MKRRLFTLLTIYLVCRLCNYDAPIASKASTYIFNEEHLIFSCEELWPAYESHKETIIISIFLFHFLEVQV